MNKKFFPTNNYHKLTRAVEALKNREPSLPGMGLVYGKWGIGKSEAIDHYYGESDIYYVRAQALWSPRDLLKGICDEFTISPEYRTVERFDQVCKEASRRRSPIFIDEADYLFKRSINLDVLRDIHDITKVPIILVGMERAFDKLNKYGQFWSRILPSGIVEFAPVSPPEIILATRDWTSLAVDPDAAEALCIYTEGDWRLIVGCLVALEQACHVNQTQKVSKLMVDEVQRKLSKQKRAGFRKANGQLPYSLGRTQISEKTP